MKRLIIMFCLALPITVTGCAHSEAPTPAPKTAPKAPITIRGEGVRTTPFAAPSLAAFVAAYPITTIVEGDVVSVAPEVSADQNYINTRVAVAVSRALGTTSPVITVTEPGGVVPLRQVRSQFEGKEGAASLTEDDLDQLVDFRMDGEPHSQVGQHVVMFLRHGEEAGTAPAWSLAAKLIRSLNGLTYDWPEGEQPNPRWAARYDAGEIGGFLTGSP